ncbi:hypothetical protein UCREL1_10057 [Eutypa lata UCREL1]|uniref:Uncharacterized protein n=1 Tax=Eutypa lata (strain UCR-EL1) TaxID=1287681 RepID=M7T8L0_EUTLA|nr:hypothetical protein UCREL1_10057 [Eutypa lata UCREL1]
MVTTEEFKKQMEDMRDQLKQILSGGNTRSKDVDERMDLWTQLQFIKWNPSKQSALDHVVEFRYLIRRAGEAQMPTNPTQQVTMFINSIQDQDGGEWKARMRRKLRQEPDATINQVCEDFIAHRGIQKGGQSHSIDKKQPLWNEDFQLLCPNCGKYGYHLPKNCTKKKVKDDAKK